MSVRLAVYGGGRMGEALVTGLVAARRDELEKAHRGVQVRADGIRADGAVVAVKPGDVEGACRSIGAAGAARVLSIAAGVPLARLEGWLGGGVPVVRAMPNTPALVGAGAAAIAGGASVTDDDLAWAEMVLSSVGTVHRVAEPLLDAVTGLSGSG